jgi:hypothetical protein
MNEAELQDNVIKTAHLFGWRVAHFRPALTAKGWRTPVSADGKGFPDLVCLRREQCLVVELKGDHGRLAPEQDDWLRAFIEARINAAIWTPKEWNSGMIERILR